MEQTKELQALNTINQALEIAQRKGAFSLKDSATIVVALDTLNRYHTPVEDKYETEEGVGKDEPGLFKAETVKKE